MSALVTLPAEPAPATASRVTPRPRRYRGVIAKAHGRPDGCIVLVQIDKFVRPLVRPLDPRFDLANHSPTGFAWGYGGSGPAQLALALLADALADDERALAFYQEFKQRFVAKLASDQPWSCDDESVREIAAAIEHTRSARTGGR